MDITTLQTTDQQKHAQLWGRYSMTKIEKFDKWLDRNKIVYKMFCQYAKQYRDAGYDRCSAALIGNRLRWETAIQTFGNEYKISNDYLPMLARKLACEDSTFATFFQFKGMAGKDSLNFSE